MMGSSFVNGRPPQSGADDNVICINIGARGIRRDTVTVGRMPYLMGAKLRSESATINSLKAYMEQETIHIIAYI